MGLESLSNGTSSTQLRNAGDHQTVLSPYLKDRVQMEKGKNDFFPDKTRQFTNWHWEQLLDGRGASNR